MFRGNLSFVNYSAGQIHSLPSGFNEVIFMAGKDTNQGGMVKQLKFVTLFPAGAGTCMAILIFLIQYWKWFQTGEWQGAPFAQFVPAGLVQWAATKEGGLLGLKEFVQGMLSVHASVWFFVSGCVLSVLLSEIAKPWLKE
jgi:hypothetical protein